MPTNPNLSQIRKTTRVLGALSEPLSLRLFMLLRARGPLSVSQIVGSLRAPPVSQPTVSKQLQRMRTEGLVEAKRNGRTKIYEVRQAALDSVEAADVMLRCGEFVEEPLEHE